MMLPPGCRPFYKLRSREGPGTASIALDLAERFAHEAKDVVEGRIRLVERSLGTSGVDVLGLAHARLVERGVPVGFRDLGVLEAESRSRDVGRSQIHPGLDLTPLVRILQEAPHAVIVARSSEVCDVAVNVM